MKYKDSTMFDCVQEPLTRITFSAYPTCHDVNVSTALPERLDIIMGFNTGDLVWLGTLNFFCNRKKER